MATGQKFGPWTDLLPNWAGFGWSTEELCALWLVQLLRSFKSQSCAHLSNLPPYIFPSELQRSQNIRRIVVWVNPVQPIPAGSRKCQDCCPVWVSGCLDWVLLGSTWHSLLGQKKGRLLLLLPPGVRSKALSWGELYSCFHGHGKES